MRYICKNDEQFLELLNNIKEYDEIILEETKEYFFNKTINIYQSNIKIIGNNVIFNFKNIPYICNNYDNKLTQYYQENGNGINIYGNNIIIKNISIKFAAFRGLENFGNNNKFINIETAYNCDTGHSQKGNNNIIENCSSHHNFDYRLTKNNQMAFGFNSDGFSDKLHNGDGNTYINCVSYFNGDDGYTFFQRETPKNKPTIMKNCKAYNNGGELINISLNQRLLEDNDNPYKSQYIKESWPNYGVAHGFKLGGIHKTTEIGYKNYHYIKLYNCNSLNNHHCGYNSNHNDAEIYLEDCIGLNNMFNFNFQSNCKLSLINCKSYPIDRNIILEDNVQIIDYINNEINY